MAIAANLVYETSPSTGAGAMSLASALFYRQFSDAFAIGQRFYYSIKNQKIYEWEVGVGYLTSTNTLVRETVIENSLAGLGFINFTAGIKDVICDLPAQVQNRLAVGTPNRLMGYDSSGGFQEVSIGSGLNFTSGVLSSSGGGGTPGGSSGQAQYNNGGVFNGFGLWNGNTFAVTGNTSGISGFVVHNNNSAGTSEFFAENSNYYRGSLFKVGPGYGGYKTLASNDLGFYNDANGGNISILNDSASGKILLAAAGSAAPHLTIELNGNVSVAKDLNLVTTSSSGAGVINQNGNPFIHSFGTNNIWAGNNTGNFSTTGINNAGFGISVMPQLRNGSNNLGGGLGALYSLLDGNNNLAQGSYSQFANLYGNGNTSYGSGALYNMINGNNHTAIGASTLLNTNGTGDIGIGYAAGLSDYSGIYNNYIGYYADCTVGNLTNASAFGAYAKVSASNTMAFGGAYNTAYAVAIANGTPIPTTPWDTTRSYPSGIYAVESYRNAGGGTGSGVGSDYYVAGNGARTGSIYHQYNGTLYDTAIMNYGSGGFADALKILGNNNNALQIASLATGGTPPTITGVTRNLVSDANGTVSFMSGFKGAIRIVTGSGAVSVLNDDYTVVINKTTGSATPVSLPVTAQPGQVFIVKDGKGDAIINNITVTPSSELIDGAASYTISSARAAIPFQFDGTNYWVV